MQNFEHIRCRLHLYSVLGAMPKLLRLSPEARRILGNERFSVRFRTASGLRSTLAFADGEAVFHAEADADTDLTLFFVSDAQVNKLFDQKGLSVPLPVRGLLQMGKMRVFKEMADLLHRYLRPSREDLQLPGFRDIHVKMLLGLSMRAACQLGEHEPESRLLLHHAPQGLATFTFEGSEDVAWVWHQPGAMRSGFGTPPRPPDVAIWFKDSQIALDALLNKVDLPVEVCLGRIRIVGLLPLAEALGLVMQRIPTYLDAPHA